MNLIGIDAFRAGLRAQRVPEGGVYRVSTAKPRAFEDGTRKVRFVFSDGSVDRMGDTIAPDGWQTDDFMANPVALWAHDSSSPPIGRASNLGVEDARLMGDIEFVDAAIYAFGDTIYRLVVGGFVNAVSVGFLPIEYSFVENDPDRGWGIDFKRQELLEISVCPVPANANALIAARRKGIDTRPLAEWAERTLDAAGVASRRVLIPRKELEALRKAAKEPPMARRPGTRRRADDDPEDKPDDSEDKAPGGATCGRKAADECGLKDSTECAIHGKGTKQDDDDDENEKRLRRLERNVQRLLELATVAGVTLREVGDDPEDELPTEHHDAVRMAHKHIKSAHAFGKAETECTRKAIGLLSDVVESLDGSAEDPDGDPDDPAEPEERAKQLQRAAALARRLRAA
jgi:HK97 family phage prohead protease